MSCRVLRTLIEKCSVWYHSVMAIFITPCDYFNFRIPRRRLRRAWRSTCPPSPTSSSQPSSDNRFVCLACLFSPSSKIYDFSLENSDFLSYVKVIGYKVNILPGFFYLSIILETYCAPLFFFFFSPFYPFFIFKVIFKRFLDGILSYRWASKNSANSSISLPSTLRNNWPI